MQITSVNDRGPDPRDANKTAMMTALDGFRTDLKDWRAARPMGGDRDARLAWRDQRPERPDLRALMGQLPHPGAVSYPTQIAPVPPIAPAWNPQAPAGNYGTSLGVIGATPATSPTGLPTY